jgi:hypothetical protein
MRGERSRGARFRRFGRGCHKCLLGAIIKSLCVFGMKLTGLQTAAVRDQGQVVLLEAFEIGVVAWRNQRRGEFVSGLRGGGASNPRRSRS